MTLQPFSSYSQEVAYARYFAQSLRGDGTFGPAAPVPPGPGNPTGISPDAPVFIYAQWPSNVLAGWDSVAWLATTSSNALGTAIYYETMVNELRATEPATEFFLIPVGHVFHELNQLSRAGRIPGINGQSDWMADSLHLNDRGSYVVGLSFYSVIYRADPRGQSVVAPYPVTAEQAAVIQQAVWKVVSNHPQCGVATNLTITTASVPDARQGIAYSANFTAGLAAGAVTWSLAAGTLPTGLTLGTDGVLSGTPSAPGFYDFTVQAHDAGGHTAQRAYIALVISDDPPKIATYLLPPATVGTPYSVVLERTGGFGPFAWQVSGGDLPLGLSLSTDGVLAGTPISVADSFVPTLALTDSVGGSDAKSLALVVAPPAAGTIIAAPLSSPPTINGSLAESFWTLPHTANQSLSGAVDNSASFSVRWDTNAIYVAVRVLDDVVVPAADAVHVFFDGNHDREIVFNADDRQIVAHPNGAWTEENGRPAGIAVATATTTNGYTVEIKVPFANLGHLPDGQSLTFGFDVAVEDVDSLGGAVAVQGWHGTALANPAPATMGNLVLDVAPVGTNLLVNGNFSNTALVRPAYPAQATTSMAGTGWVANAVSTRPFAKVDATGYGYPGEAMICYGDATGTCIYQVIGDGRQTKGSGALRFDIKWAAADIKYRLFGYNGTPASVDPRIGVQSQQHPAEGGSPDATLLAGDLSAIPATSSWRAVALPVDFGTGYDYLILAFSSRASNVNVESHMDNVELGAVIPEQQIAGSVPAPPAHPPLLVADLTGINPGQHLPWMPTRLLDPNLSYSGIVRGTGITGTTGTNALFYYQNNGSTYSTLAKVINDRDYLGVTLTATNGTLDLAGAVFQFSVNLQNNSQAPNRFAVFSSVNGFTEPAALWVSDPVVKSGTRTLGFTLPVTTAFTGLAQVEFRLYAFNGINANKTISLNDLAISGAVPRPPATPANLTATAQGPSSIVVSWTDTADNETGFKIESKTGAAAFAQIATVGANVTSYTNAGLNAATTYTYRVRAYNATGDSGYSANASAATDSLNSYTAWAAPQGLTANSALDESPAGDGIKNLMKCALGIHAFTPGYQGHLVTGAANITGQTYLTLTYTRPEPAPHGLTYTAEIANDVMTGDWSVTNITETANTLNGAWRTITVRDIDPVTAHPRRFIRLRVNQAP